MWRPRRKKNSASLLPPKASPQIDTAARVAYDGRSGAGGEKTAMFKRKKKKGKLTRAAVAIGRSLGRAERTARQAGKQAGKARKRVRQAAEKAQKELRRRRR